MDLYLRLLSYLRPYGWRFAIASFFMVAVSATAGAAALIIQPILDNIFMSRDQSSLALLPFGVVAIYVARGVGRYFASSIMQAIGQLAVRDIRNDLFAKLQRLSVGFYQSRQTGHIMSRVTNDVTVVQDAVSIVVYDFVRESLTMTALLGVALYRDWKMALVAIIVIPLSGGLIQRLGRSLRAVAKESQERMADLTAMLHETCSGIRVVQAFGMEEYETERFRGGNQDYYETVRRAIVINELSSPLLEFLGALGIAGIIYYGGNMVMRGESTVGAFFSFLTALFMLYAPISKLSRVNNKIQHAMAAARRVFDLMDTPPSITEKPGAVELPPLKKSVEFRGVGFAYDHDRNALSGINLCVKKGETLALVGPSGAGKTTLVNLIPRFLDVTAGAVLIDGVDTRDVTIKSLRGQTGIVTQDVFLFHDTVRSNIAYGRNDAGMEMVVAAAKAAYAHEFIMEMPKGYDTVIGERGAKLSGGQRQRISIARAIMKDPAIMILDEATSALDSESEKMVQKALANLLAGRTTFVIAHRLSTVVNADRIIVMDRGRIAQAGSHEELMSAGGLYRRLFESQFAGETPAAGFTPVNPMEVE